MDSMIVTFIFSGIFILAMKNNWEFTALVFGIGTLIVGCETAGVR